MTTLAYILLTVLVIIFIGYLLYLYLSSDATRKDAEPVETFDYPTNEIVSSRPITDYSHDTSSTEPARQETQPSIKDFVVVAGDKPSPEKDPEELETTHCDTDSHTAESNEEVEVNEPDPTYPVEPETEEVPSTADMTSNEPKVTEAEPSDPNLEEEFKRELEKPASKKAKPKKVVNTVFPGANAPHNALNDRDRNEIKRSLNQGITVQFLADEYSVSRGTISAIKKHWNITC